VRLSMQVPYGGTPAELSAAADRVVELEKAGLDVVWVAEAYSFDAPSMMGYLAARTERIQIGAAILPIYTRTPTLLAMTAAGVDALSDGRCILGLGASGPQVVEGFHGVAYDAPLGRTREIVDICRQVWRREPVVHDGTHYHVPLPPGQGTGLGKPLKLINRPVRSRIPIYVAALGPNNVQMTAEIADGWLPLFWVPEKAAEVFGPSLAAGAAARDPELGPLEIAAGGLVAIGDDVAHLRELSRATVALYVGGMGAKGRNFYNALARRYGYEREAGLIQDLYLDGKKDEAAAAVPDEFLERINLVGPAGYVRERLAAFRESGVTMLTITPVGDDPVKIVEQLKDWTA
jgi:F420-dependent oxidoreductase-like protein